MKSQDEELTPEPRQLHALESLLNMWSQAIEYRVASIRRGKTLPSQELIEDISGLLLTLSHIARTQFPAWDCKIIKVLVDDLTDLSRGANPKYFCKPTLVANKGVLKIATNEHYALLYVATKLLKTAGLTTRDAEKTVARSSGLKLSTIIQLNKDFARSNKSEIAMKTAEFYYNAHSKWPNKKHAAKSLIQYYQEIKR